MDIDLLSKMVKELILVNDRVTLPGVGAFVAEMVPASFTDRGYTINPPYRRLVFRQGVSQEKDHLLVDMYASANNIDREMAEKLLREFLKGMVEELRKRKMLVFTGLGRLRATRENNFFFICDENLDIFPEGMGLEAVSLKSHSKPKELDFSEVDAVVNSAAEPSAESPAEPSAESPAEPSAELAAESPAEPRWWLGETEPEEEDEQHVSIWKKGWFVAVFSICCLLLLAALAFALFLLLARTQPELIDSLLYTEEELEILNHIL